MINKSDSCCAVVRFVITRLITDQVGLHSVLWLLHIKHGRNFLTNFSEHRGKIFLDEMRVVWKCDEALTAFSVLYIFSIGTDSNAEIALQNREKSTIIKIRYLSADNLVTCMISFV